MTKEEGLVIQLDLSAPLQYVLNGVESLGP
jgi:hypothetical protein